MPFKIY